jgi:GNAT superfamily N-acetyltransferase
MDEAARIAAFQRWIEDAATMRTALWRFGTALFDDDHPKKWDANFLRVERPVGTATAGELAAEADRLLAHVGHREVLVPDDTEGARLAAGFVELGYTSDRLVNMVLHREPDRSPPLLETVELTYDEIAGLLHEVARRAYPDAADALVAYDRVFAERIGARFIAARIDGTLAGCCQLYEHGGIAQIESVDTLEEFRGRGVARAFLAHAIDAARAGGADLVYICADDADWPKHLYVKLGFDEVGHWRQFTRPPRPAEPV